MDKEKLIEGIKKLRELTNVKNTITDIDSYTSDISDDHKVILALIKIISDDYFKYFREKYKYISDSEVLLKSDQELVKFFDTNFEEVVKLLGIKNRSDVSEFVRLALHPVFIFGINAYNYGASEENGIGYLSSICKKGEK